MLQENIVKVVFISNPWDSTPEPPLGITSGWGPFIGILCLSFWPLILYWLAPSSMSCFSFRRTSRTKPATVVQFSSPWSITPMMLSGDICPRADSRSWCSCAHLSHLKKVWRASSLGSPQYEHCDLPHLMEVRAEESVSRQHLCEVVVHLTMPTMEPQGQLANKLCRPSSARTLHPAFFPGT